MSIMEDKGKIKRIVSTTVQDPMMTVKEMIKTAGEVSEELGGFIIQVKDPNNFPWSELFRYLLSLNHTVWIELRDDSLFIITCPKAD
ncbi:MAG: hypothetical protein QXV24_01640 [Nitrososphaerota archaeon]